MATISPSMPQGPWRDMPQAMPNADFDHNRGIIDGTAIRTRVVELPG